MSEKTYDWGKIAKDPKYLELKQKKRRFLFSWWIGATAYYFLLLLLSAYAPGLFKIKIIGVVNFGYIFILSQFVMCIAVALIYTNVASNKFDRMTEELIESLQKKGLI